MTLLSLILKARSSETGCFTHYFEGPNRKGFFLGVDTRKSAQYLYVLGSGLVEVDFLTRKSASRLISNEG